jgi:hypothetical protein
MFFYIVIFMTQDFKGDIYIFFIYFIMLLPNDPSWWHLIVTFFTFVNKFKIQWSWKKDILFFPYFVTLDIEMKFFANVNICIIWHIVVMWPIYKQIVTIPMLTTWCWWSPPPYIVNGLSNNLYELNHSYVESCVGLLQCQGTCIC